MSLRDRANIAEVAMHQPDACPIRFEPRAGCRERRRIAVDPQDTACSCRQQRFGMAAAAKRRVDIAGAELNCEPVDRRTEQHWRMAERRHHPRPGILDIWRQRCI